MESNGIRDTNRYLSYDMPILNNEYTTGVLSSSNIAATSSLSRSSTATSNNNHHHHTNTFRGIKRTSSDMTLAGYDQANECQNHHQDIMDDASYINSNNQKGSPPSNGKKTKGRVKIKMEYIDNKLRRYTTFSKRKTGIMKKAYELSTLTGTQVMLLVASETGHVYTFATRKLQPMITSEAGKALIQTCLNSPDPCPSSSGDQRMSATGFEETELSYNIADDNEKVEMMCSPYRSDSGDSSDIESMSASSPRSSPPPLLSIHDLRTTSTAAFNNSNEGIRCIPLTRLTDKVNSTITNDVIVENNAVELAPTNNIGKNGEKNTISENNYVVGNDFVLTLEKLQREFTNKSNRIISCSTSSGNSNNYITIPIDRFHELTNPPAAHQTPADLSNRPRK